jgi:hypothetical protein
MFGATQNSIGDEASKISLALIQQRGDPVRIGRVFAQ